MRGTFRRDLTLAPGPGFQLTRRRSARAFSVLLVVAAIGWGAYDLWTGHRLLGGATAALAVAFVAQLIQAERAGWRFQGMELRSRWLRLSATEIEGVHLAFEEGRARAWVTSLDGAQVALVEGEENEVRRIADRLSGALRLATIPSSRTIN